MIRLLTAFAALIPLASGPLPGQARTLTMGICNPDGTVREVTIPLDPPQPGKRDDCQPKACHAGACREKSRKD